MAQRQSSDRRMLLQRSAALLLGSNLQCAFAQADTLLDRRPDPKTFETGDFIWPKRPGEFVPYNSGVESQYDEERRKWQEEKKSFISKVRSDRNSSMELKQLAADLDGMDFSEFITLYQADQSPGSPREFGGGASVLYVGHVGILSVENGSASVIEAVWGKGVQQVNYENWLCGRPGSWVWHGRVTSRSSSDRSAISEIAKKHVGKPYNFWEFDLSNTSGFYCSKLCWLATRDALGIAIDDNLNPLRNFWYSPKQMLKARRIEKLFSPGSYTF